MVLYYLVFNDTKIINAGGLTFTNPHSNCGELKFSRAGKSRSQILALYTPYCLSANWTTTNQFTNPIPHLPQKPRKEKHPPMSDGKSSRISSWRTKRLLYKVEGRRSPPSRENPLGYYKLFCSILTLGLGDKIEVSARN